MVRREEKMEFFYEDLCNQYFERNYLHENGQGARGIRGFCRRLNPKHIFGSP